MTTSWRLVYRLECNLEMMPIVLLCFITGVLYCTVQELQ